MWEAGQYIVIVAILIKFRHFSEKLEETSQMLRYLLLWAACFWYPIGTLSSLTALQQVHHWLHHSRAQMRPEWAEKNAQPK